MNCGYCGTELPEKALFCGECGRSLAASSGRSAPVASAPQREPVAFASAASDTAIIELGDLKELNEPNRPNEPNEPNELDGATVMTRSRPATTQPELSTRVVVNDPPHPPPADPWKPPARLLSAPVAVDDDIERTRIVSTTLTGARFVLQFSTGESVTVGGGGLVGRNPSPEPAEYFDHVVTITDPGKSVSKTHLEFGQVAGSFWISDRFSGNGTVIREPDNQPRRCDPGKRYRIARGTRVSMGEQFFVVS